MRSDIKPGATLPDYKLSDHTGKRRTLSELQGQDPLIVVLARGGYCPKDRRQHEGLAQLWREMMPGVGYCRLVTISTDNLIETNEFRNGVGAPWPFLSDAGRTIQKDLDIPEYTDPDHNPMVPHTIVCAPGPRDSFDLQRLLVFRPPHGRRFAKRFTRGTASGTLGLRPRRSRGARSVGTRRKRQVLPLRTNVRRGACRGRLSASRAKHFGHIAATHARYCRYMDGMTWMASAMRAARAQLETATHNLANAGSDGFRRARASVALTARGLVASEAQTYDQGGIRETGRRFDLALLGPGQFTVGNETTRNGAFVRDRDGWLTDDRGRHVMGERGALRLSADATIASDGSIHEGDRVINRLHVPPGTTIRAGALESSNVDAIGETLAILTAQRTFETAQKTLVAIDETRQKAVNDVVRIK